MSYTYHAKIQNKFLIFRQMSKGPKEKEKTFTNKINMHRTNTVSFSLKICFESFNPLDFSENLHFNGSNFQIFIYTMTQKFAPF